MSDAFSSARRKLNRAKSHLANLKRESDTFLKGNPCEIFSEPHPNKPEHTVAKLRITKEMPDCISEITGDVVDNLRSALDHAMYGVAVAAGRSKINNAYFPFSGDATKFDSNMKGRCADVPQEIYPLLRSFEPYKGGSDLLYTLNLVCIANKHKIVVPFATATQSAGVNVVATGYAEMPYTPVWDSAKNEMILFTLGPQTEKFHGNFKFATYIVFGDVDTVRGEPAIPILDQFVDMVETIVSEIEVETRRLGFNADL